MSPRLRYDTPFTMIDRAVLMHEELSVYDKTVYAILCSYANSEDGSCYPSYQTIARKAGCSRRKVISVIANLERLGLVEKQEQFNSVGDNTSNLYVVKPLADASGSPPDGANSALPYADDSPPNAGDTPKRNPLNEIQINHNHSSIMMEARVAEWKSKIEYSYFEEEMSDKLAYVDSMLGVFCELEQEENPEWNRLLATVDELVVMEFLEELRDRKFSHVKHFRAYFKKMFIEFLRQRAIMLAAI